MAATQGSSQRCPGQPAYRQAGELSRYPAAKRGGIPPARGGQAWG